MTSAQSEFIEIFTLVTALMLLVLAIPLLVYLRRMGGVEFSLAQSVAIPRHRKVFLAGLVVSLAAIFAIGLSVGIGAMLGLSNDVGMDLLTGFYGLGVGGMLLLMFNSVRTREPTLEAGWSLQETGERLSIAATPRVPQVDLGETAPDRDTRRKRR